MNTCKTSKKIILEWCKKNLSTHTDWTGTRIETKHRCEDVEDFVNKLFEYIKENSCRV